MKPCLVCDKDVGIFSDMGRPRLYCGTVCRNRRNHAKRAPATNPHPCRSCKLPIAVGGAKICVACRAKRTLARACEGCRAEFVPSNRNQRFCRVGCHSKGKPAPRPSKIPERTCRQCGVLYRPIGSRWNQELCSRACYTKTVSNSSIQNRSRTCVGCGVGFVKARSGKNKGLYCSRECAYKNIASWHNVSQVGAEQPPYSKLRQCLSCPTMLRETRTRCVPCAAEKSRQTKAAARAQYVAARQSVCKECGKTYTERLRPRGIAASYAGWPERQEAGQQQRPRPGRARKAKPVRPLRRPCEGPRKARRAHQCHLPVSSGAMDGRVADAAALHPQACAARTTTTPPSSITSFLLPRVDLIHATTSRPSAECATSSRVIRTGEYL